MSETRPVSLVAVRPVHDLSDPPTRLDGCHVEEDFLVLLTAQPVLSQNGVYRSTAGGWRQEEAFGDVMVAHVAMGSRYRGTLWVRTVDMEVDPDPDGRRDAHWTMVSDEKDREGQVQEWRAAPAPGTSRTLMLTPPVDSQAAVNTCRLMAWGHSDDSCGWMGVMRHTSTGAYLTCERGRAIKSCEVDPATGHLVVRLHRGTKGAMLT